MSCLPLESSSYPGATCYSVQAIHCNDDTESVSCVIPSFHWDVVIVLTLLLQPGFSDLTYLAQQLPVPMCWPRRCSVTDWLFCSSRGHDADNGQAGPTAPADFPPITCLCFGGNALDNASNSNQQKDTSDIQVYPAAAAAGEALEADNFCMFPLDM